MRWDIVEEHLEEASFLFGQWELIGSAPDYVFPEVAELEARLGAHVDALVLAGLPASQRMLEKALMEEESSRVAAATLALLGQGARGTSTVLEHLRVGSGPSQRRGITSAMRTCERRDLASHLLPWMEGGEPDLQALLLGLLGHWRVSPGPVLQRLLVSSDPQVQAAAFRCAAQVPVPVELEILQQGLSSPEPRVREAALETGMVLGCKEAWIACLAIVKAHDQAARLPMLMVAMGGGPKEQVLLLDALAVSALRQDALWALGFCGRVQAADASLSMMDDEDPFVARLAGEAFASITGLDLKKGYAAEEPPEGDVLPPLEQDLDTDLQLVPEDALPLPSSGAIARWWTHARSSFAPQGRYLGGKPFSWRVLLENLEHGAMRRRPAYALELAIRSQGEFRVPLRAFSPWQRRELVRARKQEELPCPSFDLLPLPRGRSTPSAAREARMASAEPTSRGRRIDPLGPHALAVQAVGMVSPLGDDVVMSCASSRAGITRITALDAIEVWDPDEGKMQPASGYFIPGLTEGFTGFGRLVRLGVAGLKDLLGRTHVSDWRRTGLFITLSDGQHLLNHEKSLQREAEADQVELESLPGEFMATQRRICEQRLLMTLARQVEPGLSQARLRLFWQGRTGFVQALQEANQALARSELEQCIVGGIDSLVDSPLLEALKNLNRLKAPCQPVGFLPGECAAFALVDKGRAQRTGNGTPQCILDGLSISTEGVGKQIMGAAEAGRALGLSMEATLGGMPPATAPVTLLLGCINGEDRTAYRWGHARAWLSARGLLDDTHEWHPALSFGEIGAATGPAALCLAAHALGRKEPPPGNSLVWLMDECGERGSFLVRSAGG